MTIVELLQNHAGDILSEAYQAMSRAQLKSYQAVGAEQTKQRLQALYDLVVQGVQERNLTPMRLYAKAIAIERFEAGFDLWEVQTAFNVLEEAIWLRILKELWPSQFAEALGLVSTILSAGKDTLARTYIGLASKTNTPSLNVQFLFAGTESAEEKTS
jgi:hypothetical protein